MKQLTRVGIRVIICSVLVTILLSACSTFFGLLDEAKPKRPQVEFAGARLSGLSFDTADFLFDLKIRNPNPLGLKMAGFDYDFLINGTSFIKGDQKEELEIEPQGESTIHLPLSLGFMDLYQTFQNLRNQDVSTYQLKCGFSFDVPILGLVNIPVSKSGEFPLLKLPEVSLGALKLESLNLSGAKLQLRVGVNNPNAFSMVLDRLQYHLEVNDLNWISGDMEKHMQVAEKGESFIEIPIFLNFLQIGRSAYQVLTGDKNLGYQFAGKIDLATSIPLLGQVNLPFDRSGQVKLIK